MKPSLTVTSATFSYPGENSVDAAPVISATPGVSTANDHILKSKTVQSYLISLKPSMFIFPLLILRTMIQAWNFFHIHVRIPGCLLRNSCLEMSGTQFRPAVKFHNPVKDVRAHCYCASLVRTLHMTWRVPRHVFQARAPSRNSTKYRADDLSGNLICEYFCWMLGDPHFFFGRSLPFLILSIILKNKKKSVRGKF